METRDFLVPDLGEGLAGVTIVRWLVAPGQQVALNEVLCVVETEKATVEIPSPFAGSIVELGGGEEEWLLVGTLLVRMEVTESRHATLVGHGGNATLDRSRRRAVSSAEVTASAPSPSVGVVSGRALTKPPIRKLAKELGVDLSAIAVGTGPHGMISRDDVRAAADTPRRDRVMPAPFKSVAVRGVRAVIAERMKTSRTKIPDATCSVTLDCSRLLEVRVALNLAAERQGVPAVVTPFSLICRLLAQALTNLPLLNATFHEAGPEIVLHDAVHLGIGTATRRGLLITVVRDAQRRTTLDISREIVRLAGGARDGTLPLADLQGSTFTVSNFGALGLDDGIPVINYPEAAILGIGSIKPRPHVIDGEVVARQTATFTLAFDHRVCDGADAAKLLTMLRELVESPELALLLA